MEPELERPDRRDGGTVARGSALNWRLRRAFGGGSHSAEMRPQPPTVASPLAAKDRRVKFQIFMRSDTKVSGPLRRQVEQGIIELLDLDRAGKMHLFE